MWLKRDFQKECVGKLLVFQGIPTFSQDGFVERELEKVEVEERSACSCTEVEQQRGGRDRHSDAGPRKTSQVSGNFVMFLFFRHVSKRSTQAAERKKCNHFKYTFKTMQIW